LFVGDLKDLEPADGVVPYTVVSPLFSDFAGKDRFIVLPDGETIAFSEDESWAYPEGTTLVKNFFFDLDRRDPDAGEFLIIETRLLEFGDEGWTGSTYVWNDEQTDAFPLVEGDRITIDFTDENGDPAEQVYEIPNLDHCASCHGRNDELTFLGPFTHQLNYDVQRDGSTVNQLEWMAQRGMFDQTLPAPAELPAMVDPAVDGDLELRARSYVHANCSHCHRQDGGAGVSGLRFPFWEENPLHLGVCKIPAAAGAGTGGRSFDIVPGAPDESIVVFRMESLDPDIKMPELPTRLLDPAGIDLIREWIAAMPADDCGG
jgi:uncharacterized repeat protein (TIGR03806 family)